LTKRENPQPKFNQFPDVQAPPFWLNYTAVVELHPQWIGQSGVQAVFDAMHKAGLTYFPRLSQSKVVTFKKD